MSADPYAHVRGAFHAVAEGLTGWKHPVDASPSRSNGLGASYLASDIPALEKAAESLTRDGHISLAIPLWALALRVREAGK